MNKQHSFGPSFTNAQVATLGRRVSWLVEEFRRQFLIPRNTEGRLRQQLLREKITEAFGSIVGMAGALWMALRVPGHQFAYVLFTLSSIAMTIYFFRKKIGWFFVQQAVFTAINLTGIYCWILKP